LKVYYEIDNYLLERLFSVESAFNNLKGFDEQFINMINNRIKELKIINENLSTARIDLINSNIKWVIIP
jgi:hypothetical protein